jgi:hypothetical protein
MEFVELGGQRVAIPGHVAVDAGLRERFVRGHPAYVAPTAASAPKKVREAGAEAVDAWVAERAALPPLTAAELEPPPEPAATEPPSEPAVEEN